MGMEGERLVEGETRLSIFLDKCDRKKIDKLRGQGTGERDKSRARDWRERLVEGETRLSIFYERTIKE